MAFKGLIISAIACLHLSKALAAPLVSAHSAVELCDDEFSQNCQLHRVDMNQCTAINKPLNARWVSAAHSCWLYHNTECSGDDKFSLPMMEAPFALDKFANFNEKFNSMSMPANGKSVYCTSESHSP